MRNESIYHRHGGRRYWGAKLVSLGFTLVGHFVGVVVAAFLLQSVTASLTGAAFAAAISALPWWLHGVAQNQLRPRSGIRGSNEEKVGRLLIASMLLWPVPLIALASAVVPGFDVEGFWSYLATAIIVLVTDLVVNAPYAAVRLRRHLRPT